MTIKQNRYSAREETANSITHGLGIPLAVVALGYLTIYVAEALATGKLSEGATSFTAGRLGEKTVAGDNVLLGDILRFTADNIDEYDF